MTPDQIYQAIGKRVRARRERIPLTQGDLASRIGLTRTSISNIEQGRQKIQIHTLYALAAALDVPATVLLPSERESLGENILLEEEFSKELQPNERAWINQILGSGGQEL